MAHVRCRISYQREKYKPLNNVNDVHANMQNINTIEEDIKMEIKRQGWYVRLYQYICYSYNNQNTPHLHRMLPAPVPVQETIEGVMRYDN